MSARGEARELLIKIEKMINSDYYRKSKFRENIKLNKYFNYCRYNTNLQCENIIPELLKWHKQVIEHINSVKYGKN